MSENIEIKNNTFFDFRDIGINIQTSNNITLDGNIVINVLPRAINALDVYNSARGGVSICAFNYGDKCQDIRVLNNIVGGVDYTGYAAFGHICG